MIGIYRCLPGKRGGYTSGSFRSIVLANNIRVMTKEVTPLLTADDVAKIRQFSRQTKFVNCYLVYRGKMKRGDTSLCRIRLICWPSHWLRQFTDTTISRKRSYACLLEEWRRFWITGRDSEGIERKRSYIYMYPFFSISDINILLIGDPSTAKSQMLRFCSTYTFK